MSIRHLLSSFKQPPPADTASNGVNALQGTTPPQNNATDPNAVPPSGPDVAMIQGREHIAPAAHDSTPSISHTEHHTSDGDIAAFSFDPTAKHHGHSGKMTDDTDWKRQLQDIEDGFSTP